LPYPENKDFNTVMEKVGLCFQKGLPFCIYRKPKEEQITAVFQADDRLHPVVDFTESGFVFAPFRLEDGAVLLKPDQIYLCEHTSSVHAKAEEVLVTEAGKQAHLDLVQKGIQEIAVGRLGKVVLSRKLEKETEKPITEIFDKLLQSYPNAFCYLFFHPKVGTWCGATPETLVQIQNKTVRTMSLAATLPFVQGETPNWGQKELEEQQMVSDYIKERLTSSMETLDVETAKSVRAGNLWHLRSEIKGVLSQESSVEEIISLLHPTPAVCGIPTQAAKTFIVENEDYQRTYYTGFLGELNLNAKAEVSLFVNLRCMELKGRAASIYAGGGITQASDPEREWIETQNKSKTMLNIL